MNVKISESAVTFKITEEELNRLLAGTALEQKILIGGHDFITIIDPVPQDGHASFRLVWTQPDSCLKLCAAMDEIRKLSAMGKSRDGLSARAGNLDVFLQVDMRKDSRKVA